MTLGRAGYLRFEIPPDGAFWCRHDLVDATEEDVVANDAGTLTPQRRVSIRTALKLQMSWLSRATPEGSC